MRWFRKHIGQGSWLALLALAINFTLAFGHFHPLGGHDFNSPVLVVASTDGAQNPNGLADHHDDGLCSICMAIAIMAKGLASVPSTAPPIDFAEAGIHGAIDQLFSAPRPQSAGFQSRGPPLS